MDEMFERLRDEWRALDGVHAFRCRRLAITGRPAQDGRSARMVVYLARGWVHWEPVKIAISAASGRLFAAIVILFALDPDIGFPLALPFSERPIGIEVFSVVLFLWLVSLAQIAAGSRGSRRAIVVNEPLADPPLDRAWNDGPIENSGAIVLAEVVLLPLVVGLSAVQPRFHVLWVAYLVIELALIGIVLRAASRRPR